MGLWPALTHGDRGFCLPLTPQALQEEIAISGCKMRLSYLSSRTAGYKSVLRISLTHPTIPFNLMKVHLMVAVEGRLFRKWFAAAPDLSYYFIWDKTDVYNQKVFGLSEAFGKCRCHGPRRSAHRRRSTRSPGAELGFKTFLVLVVTECTEWFKCEGFGREKKKRLTNLKPGVEYLAEWLSHHLGCPWPILEWQIH